MFGRPESSSATISPSTAVSFGRSCRALTMCGYCLLKLLHFLEKRLSFPFELIARVRYPSSLISYTHSGPSGSLATARHSIGSMKAASRAGRDRLFRIGRLLYHGNGRRGEDAVAGMVTSAATSYRSVRGYRQRVGLQFLLSRSSSD